MPVPVGLGRKTAKKTKGNFQILSAGGKSVECARTRELYNVACCKGCSTQRSINSPVLPSKTGLTLQH